MFSLPKLKSVVFEYGITHILNETVNDIYEFTQFTEVIIPDSVISIGSYAFKNCSNLKKVTFNGNAPTIWESGVFANTAAAITIYYNEGTAGWTTPTWTAPDGSVYQTYMISKTTTADVTGTITSSDNDLASIVDDTITITLTSADYTYSTTVNSPGVNRTVSYCMEGVKAGTYTMTINKKGHVEQVYNVIVGTSDATMDVTLYLLGDSNHDGKADSSDAVAILRHLAGYAVENFDEKTADFNGDSKADSSDAVAILRKLAGY